MKLFKPATPYLAWLMVLLLAVASLAHAAPSRPFKASLEVEERVGRMGRCPGPEAQPGLGGTINGTGHATHLGAVQVQASHCLAIKPGKPTYVFNGEMRLTAANGDMVFADYSGHLTLVSAGVYTFEGNFYIKDGTGRFQDASGSGALFGLLQGNVSPLGQTVSLTAEGRISY